MAELPSFDLVTQALSGMMSINGEDDGPPTKIGVPMGDVGGGMWAAIAVLAALQHRTATGKGLHVDLSLLDGLIGLLGYLAEMYLVTGESPGRVGVQPPFNCALWSISGERWPHCFGTSCRPILAQILSGG